LKRLTNSSYRIIIKGKEATAMIRSLNRMPILIDLLRQSRRSTAPDKSTHVS
jgi:hypothetical protein